MSAQVLLYLLNNLKKRAVPSILSIFLNKFNLSSTNHMTLKLIFEIVFL